MELQISILMTILSALFTGGILMLFIEGLQLKGKVDERLRFSMSPFFHSFSNYLKFIALFKSCFRLKKENISGYTHNVWKLVDKIQKLAFPAIVSGKDYPITYFSANELRNVCEDINNIWYYIDKNRSDFYSNIEYDDVYANSMKENILMYLYEIAPKYRGIELKKELLETVSSDFYVTIFQPVQDILYKYEHWIKCEKSFKVVSWLTMGLTLLTMLAILFLHCTILSCYFNVACFICCMLFAYQVIKIIKIENSALIV